MKEQAMTQTMSNGRSQRKNLSEQIDRLDGILDGLAEGLNEAIAHAVQEAVMVAVQSAVQATLTEVLTNPELRRKLAGAHAATPSPASTAPAQPTRAWWQRLAGGIASGFNWLLGKAREAVNAVAHGLQNGARRAGRRAVNLYRRVQLLTRGVCGFLTTGSTVLNRLRTPLLVALGVGVAVGLGCYLAGPVVASTLSGFAGFAGSLIASLARHLWRAVAGNLPENA